MRISDWSSDVCSSDLLLPGIYTVGFSAYVPLNGFNNQFNATFNGNVIGQTLANFTVDGSTAQTWVSYADTVTILSAGDYTTTFTFASGGPGAAGDVVIDRAYVVAGDVTGGVPAPATWAMMLIGFGGLGAVLRRRRTPVAGAAADRKSAVEGKSGSVRGDLGGRR